MLIKPNLKIMLNRLFDRIQPLPIRKLDQKTIIKQLAELTILSEPNACDSLPISDCGKVIALRR